MVMMVVFWSGPHSYARILWHSTKADALLIR